MKHYKLVDFFDIYNVKLPRTYTKPPRTNAKPPYWKLSGDDFARCCAVLVN